MQHSLRTIGRVPFDLGVLKSFFLDHQHITDKARLLVSNGQIIRLKKGLYILSEDYSDKKYRRRRQDRPHQRQCGRRALANTAPPLISRRRRCGRRRNNRSQALWRGRYGGRTLSLQSDNLAFHRHRCTASFDMLAARRSDHAYIRRV